MRLKARRFGETRPDSFSEDGGDPGIKRPARSVGGGGDSEAAAVAKLNHFVEKVETVEAQLQFTDACRMQMPDVFHAGIHGNVCGIFFKVRKTFSQAVAIKEVGVQLRVFQKRIGDAARTGVLALVIKLNVIIGDVVRACPKTPVFRSELEVINII